ncbi:MAG: SurA N-terminal domain-containing protein [Thermodesulfobacteriota bacterium]|nr:SurA N-terminal domain-containing protein [Thermodesulfobacteriota bacterium]
MLRFMRQQAGNWLIKVLLGAIVIVFIFWGVGSFRAQRGGRVALVNGDQITLDEYREAYNNLIEQLRERFGNNLNEDMIKMLQVKKQALNRLIDSKLLVQEARRFKFRVSDKELADAIIQIGAFQSAGVFDNRLYQNVLGRLRMTPEEFEIAQRDAMLIERLKVLITSSAKVSDQEVREWFNWANALVNIDFVRFDPDKYKDIKASSEEIKAFFEKHKENYKTDAMVKVRYLHFDPDKYRSKVSISDEELQDYFDENQEEFNTPKTVEARHILLKVDQNAGPEDVEKARKRALDILKMARERKDFAELAKKYSEGPTRDRGGYLGTFKREAMVKPFADKAFSLKAGEISEPVRTRFGWHIIKVEKVNEASVLSFDEAKKKIQKKLTQDKAKNLAYDEAEAVSDVSFEGDDLLKSAKERKLKILTTDFFTKKGPEKGIKNRAKFASAAFDFAVMEITDIQEFENGYYILQVIEKIPEKIPELKKVKEKVRVDLIQEKQNANAKKDANTYLTALKSGKSMTTESKHFNFTPTSTGFFKRSDSIPKIEFEREVSKAAFQLTPEKKLPEKPIKGTKGYYVIQFKDRKTPEFEEFNTEKSSIKQRLLQQKKTRTFDALLAQIRSNSEITIKEGFLE